MKNEFINPVKAFMGYKSEMTLSQVVMFFEKQNIIFTKTMIQHYLKSGALPPLIGKRHYGKLHICALTIIHILKDVYSLDQIKSVFEPLYGESFEAEYDSFIKMYEEAVDTFKTKQYEPGFLMAASAAAKDVFGELITLSIQ